MVKILTEFCCISPRLPFGVIRWERHGCPLQLAREPKPFDTSIVIPGEINNWLRGLFTKVIFQAYGQIKCGEDDASLDEIIEAMKPDLIDAAAERTVCTVHELTTRLGKGHERELMEKLDEIAV